MRSASRCTACSMSMLLAAWGSAWATASVGSSPSRLPSCQYSATASKGSASASASAVLGPEAARDGVAVTAVSSSTRRSSSPRADAYCVSSSVPLSRSASSSASCARRMRRLLAAVSSAIGAAPLVSGRSSTTRTTTSSAAAMSQKTVMRRRGLVVVRAVRAPAVVRLRTAAPRQPWPARAGATACATATRPSPPAARRVRSTAARWWA